MTASRYTVSRKDGCIVIEGAIPISDLTALIRAWEKDRADADPPWIVDSLLSGHLNCNMVLGPPEACLAWRDRLGIAPIGPPKPFHLRDQKGAL